MTSAAHTLTKEEKLFINDMWESLPKLDTDNGVCCILDSGFRLTSWGEKALFYYTEETNYVCRLQ